MNAPFDMHSSSLFNVFEKNSDSVLPRSQNLSECCVVEISFASLHLKISNFR